MVYIWSMETRDNNLLTLEIALNCKKSRINSGLNQPIAAKMLGMSRSSLAQLEMGNRAIQSEILFKMAILYDVDVSSLYPEKSEYRYLVNEYIEIDGLTSIASMEQRIKELKNKKAV